jgi:hypothetical protein
MLSRVIHPVSSPVGHQLGTESTHVDEVRVGTLQRKLARVLHETVAVWVSRPVESLSVRTKVD